MNDPKNGEDRPDLPGPAEIPVMQKLLDNPFLLLLLGILVPAVFYLIWGIIEITQIPVAQ